MVDILSIDIFYSGQCNAVSNCPVVLCIIFIVIYFVTKPIINYICVCLYQIHKIDATAAAACAGIFDVALAGFVYLVVDLLNGFHVVTWY